MSNLTIKQQMKKFFENLHTLNEDQLKVALNTIWIMENLLIDSEDYNPYTQQPKSVQLILCKIKFADHPKTQRIVQYVVHNLHQYYRHLVTLQDDWIAGNVIWELKHFENWRYASNDLAYNAVDSFKSFFNLSPKSVLGMLEEVYLGDWDE